MLAVGLTYPVLEGLVSLHVIVRSRLPWFTRQALESAFMGSFGNVICLGAGSMPMQSLLPLPQRARWAPAWA